MNAFDYDSFANRRCWHVLRLIFHSTLVGKDGIKTVEENNINLYVHWLQPSSERIVILQ